MCLLGKGKKKKSYGNIFLFILYIGSKKCFNAKKFFLYYFKPKNSRLREGLKKKGNCLKLGGDHQGLKKNFFAFLDDSDYV